MGWRCEADLEVFQGELQHVPEDIAEDLRLPLDQNILVVQRLDHFGLHLEQKTGVVSALLSPRCLR